jgi:hypothetical protein
MVTCRTAAWVKSDWQAARWVRLRKHLALGANWRSTCTRPSWRSSVVVLPWMTPLSSSNVVAVRPARWHRHELAFQTASNGSVRVRRTGLSLGRQCLVVSIRRASAR